MRLAILLPLALAVAPVAMASTPRPGKLETYRDWITGCDNGKACTTASLFPEEAALETSIAVTVSRGGAVLAQPVIWVGNLDNVKGRVTILIDGKPVATTLAAQDEVHVTGARGLTLARAMAKGRTMEVRSGSRLLGTPSLRGAAAALRYIDAQQGRAGSTTALIATGPLRRTVVAPPPALPVVPRLRAPRIKPTALSPAEREQAAKISSCAPEDWKAWPIDLYPLSRGRALALVPCGSGAYNGLRVPLIASGPPGRRKFATAAFDLAPGWRDDGGKPMLVNAGFDPATSTVSSYAKGRGLGDCGNSETYVWDGRMFRLIEAKEMGECRGAWQWITTWRARPVP